jgi:hypothetical protein
MSTQVPFKQMVIFVSKTIVQSKNIARSLPVDQALSAQ